MNEKEFLELSEYDQGIFIKVHVFGALVEIGIYVREIPTTWQGLGKGIEHGNEDGLTFRITQWSNKSWRVRAYNEPLLGYLSYADNENIFLAFWIAYMRALGVLE